ncbi:alpha/beta hydrolase family protein [Thalassotalea ganghwensis]
MFRIATLSVIVLLFIGCGSTKTPEKEWIVSSQQNQLDVKVFTAKMLRKEEPVVIMIHGDGPSTADASSYYLPIIELLNNKNINVVSWHKPGVESSSGNWLTQSMTDRAQEVEDVIRDLRKKGYIGKIGILGFSQAGWVFPYIDNSLIDFIALVSPAINWKQQSIFLMKQRLINEKLIASNDTNAEQEIKALVDREYQLFNQGFSAYKDSDLHHHPYMSEPISDEDRFNFVRLNMNEDATEAYEKVKVPMVVLLGDKDTNIDVVQTLSVLQQVEEENQAGLLNYRLFTNANHQLLNADEYINLTGLDWYIKFQQQQAEAFAPNVLPFLTGWLSTVVNN